MTQEAREEYQVSLLLRLQPGDPGYNTWQLALREYVSTVERLLRAVEGVPEAEEAEEEEDDNPLNPAGKVAAILASCPVEYSVL